MAKSFITKTALSGMGGLLHASGTLISGIIVARVIGPHGTGIVSLSLWIVFVGTAIGGLGLQTAVKRFFPELEANGNGAWARGVLARSYLLTIISTLTMAFLLALVGVFVWRPVGGLTWGLIVACFVVTNIGDFYLAYLSAVQDFKKIAKIQAQAAAIRVVLVLLGAVAFGADGALIAYIASYAVPLWLAFRHLSCKKTFPVHLSAQIVKFCAYSWLAVIVHVFVWTRAEIVFIDAALGTEQVGLFAAGLGLANLAGLVPTLLGAALLPHLSQRKGEGAEASMRGLYRNVTIIAALVAFPICLGGSAISPLLLPLLFGQSFAGGIESGMIVIAGSIVVVFAVNANSLLLILDKGHLLLLSNILGVLLVVAAGVFVVPSFGLVGAAWSRVTVQGIVVALQLVWLHRCGYSFPAGPIVRIAIASTVCWIAAYVLVSALDDWLSLVPAVAVGAVAYVAALRLLRVGSAISGSTLERAIDAMPRALQKVMFLLLWLIDANHPSTRGTAK